MFSSDRICKAGIYEAKGSCKMTKAGETKLPGIVFMDKHQGSVRKKENKSKH